MSVLLALVAGAGLFVWLWRRADVIQLNVFSHRGMWLLAIGAVMLGLLAGDNGTWTHNGKAYMSDMNATQWLVLLAMVVFPPWLVIRALRKGGNALSGAGVRALALGVVAWIALGYLTAPLYYGCNPLNPFCR